MTWILPSLAALVCFSGAFLLIARLGGQLGTLTLLTWLLLLQALAAAVHMLATATGPWVSWAVVPTLLLAAGLCYLGNLAQTCALARAPNPGFSLAIIGASMAVVAIVSALVCGAPLGVGKISGVAMCVAGVACVAMSR
jgi:hypothetical protein